MKYKEDETAGRVVTVYLVFVAVQVASPPSYIVLGNAIASTLKLLGEDKA